MTKFKILFCLFVSLPFSRACEQCSFSSWHTWSKCSESCGGGIKTRQRSVCCPPEILYDTCLNSLCKDKVTYNDTQQTAVCNDHCLEGGTYNEGCSCRAGWTGRCCGIPCGDKIHGVNCSQGCECAEGLKCEKNSGQCVLRESVVKAKDGRECQTCELRDWGSWGSCDQQCGGGMKIRYREVCCPEIIDYHTCTRETCRGKVNLSEIVSKGPCNLDCYNGGIYNETCQCKPGWSGRCCDTNCDDGYFGDGFNSTCNCLTGAVCDKETGACLQKALLSGHSEPREETSTRLYIIIGSGIGVFFIVQILIIILIDGYIKGRKRRKAEITARLDKEKFWSGKTAFDGSENLYEEIPFDKKGENNSKISKIYIAKSVNKTSVKKPSIQNGIVKGTKDMKSEDIYQGLAKTLEDSGYQALINPDAMKYMAIKPAVINLDSPVYISMSDSPNKSSDKAIDQTRVAGYMAMYSASGETCENKKKLYNFDVE
ncbi:multiple epidermal growth factor-like domains protein 10 isoform X2 [Mytilus trossulus]|uniref:multiple epidermal growth factor-like domains protein 10 isoform X2 n=1 Tax=Mytilus trossulus TaxID=6551 RepID=UPI0030062A82